MLSVVSIEADDLAGESVEESGLVFAVSSIRHQVCSGGVKIVNRSERTEVGLRCCGVGRGSHARLRVGVIGRGYVVYVQNACQSCKS